MKQSNIQYSFITAAFNCLDLTRAYLISFQQTVCLSKDQFEIILIDDCSTEPIQDLVSEFESLPINFIRNETNQGFGESNNKGARAAQGEYLFLLNNDLTLLPGWFEPMANALESEKFGAVGNIQINPQSKLMDHAGVAFDLKGVPFHARKNRRRTSDIAIHEWPAVTAACMGIRKDLFLKLGGFDNAYRNGAEDIDLCMKLRKAGYLNVVCNQSVIYHKVSSSPGRHDFNEHNLSILMGRWKDHGKTIGQKIWATEYLHRYARHWWKFSPSKLAIALFRLCMIRN
ncbi:MAG: glycosyltransferase family 2 protein [Opitutales bacterium]